MCIPSTKKSVHMEPAKLSCTDQYKAIPGNRHLPKFVTGGPVDLVATVVLAVTRVPGLIHPWEGIDQEF